MTLPQLEGLAVLDREPTDGSFGVRYDRRTVGQLLRYGIILLDKPPGPTSHEVAAWTKRMLGIDKVGHSGTLDPGVSGVLPLGLGEATKALGVLLLDSKEYVALGRLHSMPAAGELSAVVGMFTGEIFQRPPQRSAVSRSTRTRTIHELEVLEQKERLVLSRISCESGTYIRKLYYDMGEVLGPGATMIELRRTRVAHFAESGGLVTLHALADAFARWRDGGDPGPLSGMIRPVEAALEGLKSVVIRDTAVDAMCHGAQLAVPGVLEVSEDLAKGDMVAVYTQKGEAVALAEASMTADGIRDAAKGHAFVTKRIIMAPGTYPRAWKRRDVPRGGDSKKDAAGGGGQDGGGSAA